MDYFIYWRGSLLGLMDGKAALGYFKPEDSLKLG
jgi:hypothetical protein